MPEFVDEIVAPLRALAVQILPYLPVACLREIEGRAEDTIHQRAAERAPRRVPLRRAARGDEIAFLYRYGSHDSAPASCRFVSKSASHASTMKASTGSSPSPVAAS